MSSTEYVPKPWESEWAAKKPEPPPVLTPSAQLFVDDVMIERRSRNLCRRINPPVRHPDPVLVPTLEWEGHGVISYGSVIKLPGTDRYRLYYRTDYHAAPLDDWDQSSALCYAESADLFHWDKPVSADFPYFTPKNNRRWPATNALTAFGHDCASVLLDEHDPDPERRFKLAYSPANWWAGLNSAVSRDGLRWKHFNERILNLGDRMSLYYNPVKKKYTAWSRCYAISGDRAAYAAESDDFIKWYPIPHLVLHADEQDLPETGIYGATAFWYESQLLGFVEIFRGALGKLYTQFMSSRDGHAWRRDEHREAFIPNGPHGSRDGYWVFPTDNAPLRIGDRLYLLISERNSPHPPVGACPAAPSATIGLATMRVDGFVSLDAGTPGWVVTKPFVFQGRGTLTVNACPFFGDSPSPMSLAAEVYDESGRAIEGYTLADAVPVHGDNLQHEIRWKNRADLAEQKGRPIRLAFRMDNTRLYSYRVV